MNPDTHFYLYAKGHYEKKDLIEDLCHILSERSNIPPKYCTIKDISRVLITICWKEISTSGNPQLFFIDFIANLIPENRWRICKKNNEDFIHALLYNCLYILRFAKVKDLNLGNPDSNILPLKKEEN